MKKHFCGGWILGMSCLLSAAIMLTSPCPGGTAAAASPDFNGDGSPDILWRHETTGQIAVWYMNGATLLSAAMIGSIDTHWEIAGTADLNGDGKPDILWRHRTSGAIAAWHMNGAAFVSAVSIGSLGMEWEIAGTPDMNGDGKPDILWRHRTTGQIAVWYMDGVVFASAALIGSTKSAWEIVGTPDLNGDGKPDILWRHRRTGQIAAWYMNGAAFVSAALIGTIEPGWEIMGTPDLNADGKPDILWRHKTTGQVAAWYMNGAVFVSAAGISTVDASWVIVPSKRSNAYLLEWINFSPYMGDQSPNLGSVVPEQQIRDRLEILSPYTRGIRTFGSTHGLEHTARISRTEFGYSTAIGAWLQKDAQTANDNEMAGLIAAAKAGYVDIAIVGSEVFEQSGFAEDDLLAYIEQFRREVPTVPVATADTYGQLLAHPRVIAACDVVFVNIYPFWEGKDIDSAAAYARAAYLAMLAAAGGKTVYVSEIGWPSAGDAVENAVPSEENAAAYFLNVVSWARAEGVNLIYFEAFDEPWKAQDEGSQGPHWGIFTGDGVLKPGMEQVFDDRTTEDNWTCGAPVGGDGTPELSFLSVPPIGSSNDLSGQARHVIPANYRVAVYIKVGSGWWTKPYFAAPLTPIDCDGQWVTDITTGGSDTQATEIAAYLVPAGFTPPTAGGGALPESELDAHAAAKARVTR